MALHRFQIALLVVSSCLVSFTAAPARAGNAPFFLDPNDRPAHFDLSGLPRLRFLTTLDFPPFNFADADRKPTGFNVELARALCDEMKIEAKCEIQAMPWEELDPTLDGKRGEAIIAGHGITAALREKRELTPTYFRFPARFVARDEFDPGSDDMARAIYGKKVAVVGGSAHEAMLKAWFPGVEAVSVVSMEAAYSDLKEGNADLVFGDGVTLSFWLVSEDAASCCRFVSGPYLSEHYLGGGMTVVTRKESSKLSDAISAALKALEEKGTYEEIYKRYFPLDPYGPGADWSEAPKGKAERPEQSG